MDPTHNRGGYVPPQPTVDTEPYFPYPTSYHARRNAQRYAESKANPPHKTEEKTQAATELTFEQPTSYHGRRNAQRYADSKK